MYLKGGDERLFVTLKLRYRKEDRTFASKVEICPKGICNPRLRERTAGLQIQLEHEERKS